MQEQKESSIQKIIYNTVPRESKLFNICEEKAELLVLPKTVYDLYLKPIVLSKYQNRINALRSLPCFRGILNGEQYLELATQVEEVNIEEGQNVITQGQTATDLYFIIRGIGKVEKTLKYKDNMDENAEYKEKKIILGRLARNDVMGKRTLLSNVDIAELEALELAAQNEKRDNNTSEDSTRQQNNKNSSNHDQNRKTSEGKQNGETTSSSKDAKAKSDGGNEEKIEQQNEVAKGVFVESTHPFTVTAESQMVVYKLTYAQVESSSWNMQMVRKLQMMSIDEGHEGRLLQKAVDLEVWAKLKKRVLTDY